MLVASSKPARRLERREFLLDCVAGSAAAAGAAAACSGCFPTVEPASAAGQPKYLSRPQRTRTSEELSGAATGAAALRCLCERSERGADLARRRSVRGSFSLKTAGLLRARAFQRGLYVAGVLLSAASMRSERGAAEPGFVEIPGAGSTVVAVPGSAIAPAAAGGQRGRGRNDANSEGCVRAWAGVAPGAPELAAPPALAATRGGSLKRTETPRGRVESRRQR